MMDCLRSVRAAAAAIAFVAFVVPAAGKPVVKTTYTYYTITGADPVSLHQSMVRQGRGAYASTSTDLSFDAIFEQTSSGCRFRSMTTKLDFVIRLPRLKAGSRLPPDVSNRWKTFERFAREHENAHRQIWIGCANELERKVRSIRNPICSRIKSQAQAVVAQTWSACERKHHAFDTAQQKALRRQPLIQSVATSKSPVMVLRTPSASINTRLAIVP